MNEVLAKTKDKSARPVVAAILKDKKEKISVRSAAVKVLGKMGGAESLASIKEVADENLDNQEFQSSVLRSLADIGGSQGGGIIRSRLKHKDAFIKTVAARALYQLAVNTKDMTQVKPLIEMADNSQFENRNVVIKLLGEAKERQALPIIIKIAENQKEDYTYRCTAVEALGNIGGEDVDKVLLNLLSDNDELLRGYAVEALAKGKASSEKVLAFKTVLNSTRDSYVKSKIAKAQALLESKR
jgi:HEAT repeat protein